jgi:hypothetical protein
VLAGFRRSRKFFNISQKCCFVTSKINNMGNCQTGWWDASLDVMGIITLWQRGSV